MNNPVLKGTKIVLKSYAIGLLFLGGMSVFAAVMPPSGNGTHLSPKNKLIDVQGKLTNATGDPLSGTYGVTFRLYLNAYDPIASSTWTETQVITSVNGQFNVTLGNVNVLNSLAFTSPYYLGMQVAGDPDELTPRQMLGASAYALGSLGDFNVQGNLQSNGQISAKISVSASSMSVNGQDVQSYLVPVGAIMMFANSCPNGWTRFSQLDNSFPVGAPTYGATGGSATHSHSISTDGAHVHSTPPVGLNSATKGNGPTCMYTISCPSWVPYYPGETTSSAGDHNHGGATGVASSLPPYLAMVFCQKQ